METQLISFVIATRNRKDSLNRCLTSIRSQSYPNKEILVIDNGSDDGTSEFVRSAFAEVKLFSLPTNQGAAGGKSIGLREAQGQFIIQLDDDAAFPDTTVCETVLLYFEHNKQVGVLNFNVLNPQTQQTQPRAIPRRDKRLLFADTYCGYFLGMGCAFRTDMLRQVGYYWEKLNPYGAEEFDLSYRILEAGHAILWTKEIRICHFESPLSRPIGRRAYAETCNRIWVALRYLPWPYVFTHCVVWWSYGWLIALRSSTMLDYAKGIRDCIAGMPDVYKKRKKISPETIALLRRYCGPLYF